MLETHTRMEKSISEFEPEFAPEVEPKVASEQPDFEEPTVVDFENPDTDDSGKLANPVAAAGKVAIGTAVANARGIVDDAAPKIKNAADAAAPVIKGAADAAAPVMDAVGKGVDEGLSTFGSFVKDKLKRK